MMLKPKWRYVLPLVQTVLYAGLMAWGLQAYRIHRVKIVEPVELSIPSDESVVTFDPKFIDGAPPVAHRIAFFLNLPAGFAALPFLIAIGNWIDRAKYTTFQIELMGSAVVGLFVPPFWWLIGYVIDFRRLPIPFRHSRT